ncbi:MAG: Ig-like domain-containing protein [Gammaproteobacteria bacterium]|nr:Ig-like domain-containing protein [Gammaproteobacteria bacterium]MDE0256754.1 Ig-like domain-containing protein [Gammaproteobacteria bacterium]
MTSIGSVAPLRHVLLLLPALILACGDMGTVVEAPPPVPTTLAITPPSAVLASLGQTVHLTATVRDQTGAPMTGVAVNWASSDAGIVTVDASGVVTAVGNGATNVTATVRGGGASGSAAIAVEQQVAEVRLTPDSLVLRAIGTTRQMSAEVIDANGHSVANAGVAWESSDEAVVTVSRDGLVTATGNGSAQVTATADQASAVADFAVEQETAEVRLTPDSTVLRAIGDTLRMSAEVIDANGHSVAGARVAWESSDEAVVTVSRDGLVTATGNGSAQVTASTDGTSGVAELSVGQEAAEVRLTPDPQVLRALGGTLQMSAEVVDANGHPVADATVTWASDDESVVTVSSSGLVTAVGNGSATVSASSDPVSATVNFTVEQEVASLTVSPDSAVLSPRETLRLTADVRDANGNAVTDADVTWLSDDESVATVDAAGLVTGVRPGSAGISAQLPASSLTASARIVVQNRDRAALVALYNATGGATWTNSENWLTDQPIGTWRGVVTDVEGRVTSLNLQVNGLVGPLPDELRHLTGLHTLNLSANGLNGTLPPYLAEFADLEELNLVSNHFSGPIPSELSNLARLRSLRLHGNRFSGSIPPELGRLANLEDLGLSGNRLTGTIPANLGNLSRLNELRLHGNLLLGPIPTTLGRLTHLRLLSLCCNQLTGEIPDELGALASLTFLGLHYNQLSGPVPHELGGLHRLQRLYLRSNEQLTGPLPQQFVHLPLQVFNWVSTDLCSPANARFQEWLAGIDRHEGEGVCSSSAP